MKQSFLDQLDFEQSQLEYKRASIVDFSELIDWITTSKDFRYARVVYTPCELITVLANEPITPLDSMLALDTIMQELETRKLFDDVETIYSLSNVLAIKLESLQLAVDELIMLKFKDKGIDEYKVGKWLSRSTAIVVFDPKINHR